MVLREEGNWTAIGRSVIAGVALAITLGIGTTYTMMWVFMLKSDPEITKKQALDTKAVQSDILILDARVDILLERIAILKDGLENLADKRPPKWLKDQVDRLENQVTLLGTEVVAIREDISAMKTLLMKHDDRRSALDVPFTMPGRLAQGG